MPAKRKKWQLRYPDTAATDTLPSRKQAYEFIQALARSHAADPNSMNPKVCVWVDEGDGRWQRYEDVMLSDLTYLNAARS